MASNTAILRMKTWEGSSPILMARLVDSDDADVAQAGLDATAKVTYKIYDTDGGGEEASGTLEIADVVYDTLQTGKGWTADGSGYNFLWKIDDSLLPAATGPKTYRVEVLFTADTTLDKTYLVALIERQNVLTE